MQNASHEQTPRASTLGRWSLNAQCRLLLLGGLLLLPPASAEPITIASLNPVVSDLARQVGGNHVEVIDIMPVGADPHTFSPTPGLMKQASRATLVLAAGKGLEPYLPEFASALGDKVPVFEVGHAVPSMRIKADAVFVCCPDHATETIDPHWWHSIKATRRAAAAIADRLAELDPANADDYHQRYNAYRKRLEELYRWSRHEIGRIPRADRELATEHAAFGYLCREMGLRSITIKALSTVDETDPGYLKQVIGTLRAEHVRAVFPERGANPKILTSLVRDANVAIGRPLCAGSPPKEAPTYEAMMRYNIRAIVDALAPQGKE